MVNNTIIVGQTENLIHEQISDILKIANQVCGPDEMLENGRLYTPDHPKARGNPYLEGTDWMIVKLFIKGDEFNDVKIKYNVHLEQLILKKEINDQESHIPILLNNNFIDSFDKEGRHFINLIGMPFNNELSGFAELIYNGQLIFIVKHTKEFLKRYSQSNAYGAYSKLYSTYYVYENGKLIRLGKKGSLLKYFEPIQKEVKNFIRQQNIKYKKATNAQLYELIKFCDEKSHN